MKRLWAWGLVAGLVMGLVLLPVAGYVVGGRLIGPYPGPRGLASYFGAIFSEAGRGHPLALLLLLGPAAIVVIWWLRARLLDGGGRDSGSSLHP